MQYEFIKVKWDDGDRVHVVQVVDEEDDNYVNSIMVFEIDQFAHYFNQSNTNPMKYMGWEDYEEYISNKYF